MSSIYEPDGWTLLEHEEHGLFVLGSWRGGFTTGDSWRRNSGVKSIEQDQNNFYFYGYSGSVYKCDKGSFDRLGLYVEGICEQTLESVPKVKRLDMVEFLRQYEIEEYDESNS